MAEKLAMFIYLAQLFFVAHGARVKVSATEVPFVGRTNKSSMGTVQFDFPGVSFSFGVLNTTRVVAYMSQDDGTTENVAGVLSFPNYFEVYVDGVWQSSDSDAAHSFSTAASSAWLQNGVVSVVLADGLSPFVAHTIEVFKSTEAQYSATNIAPNYMTLYGLELEGPYYPAYISQAPLSTATQIRRLEFIGDSITAGYCNLCQDFPDDTDAAAESHAMSWPRLLSEATAAEFHSVAWSGYGLVENCCGGDVTMPQIFTRTLASVAGSPTWNYDSWIPDAVVINLGTNDVNSGLYDEDLFVATYISLVLNITAAYDRQCAFFLACGPMTTAYCAGVHRTVQNITQGKEIPGYPEQVYFLNQTTANPDLQSVTLECCGHPSSSDDAAMASAGATFVMEALGWT